VIGLDTSFLVGLALREHPVHQTCWELFQREILGQPGSMALAPQVLTEFAHVVTDPRRLERPLTTPEALELCGEWWNAQECRPVETGFDAGALFLTWMETYRLGRKRLLDTMLAATYYCAGVNRIATTDWRDFSIYEVFEVIPIKGS
jgi:predicted nucleic acid-binding protein